MTYLYIAVGGAIGSVLRAFITIAAARISGPQFPWGTMQFPWGTILINILGSFVIGLAGSLTQGDSRYEALRAFIMVGLCGGFTTFSSFSLQTLELFQNGRVAQATVNVGLSVVACLIAVAFGASLGAALR
jgi:CrcB protein